MFLYQFLTLFFYLFHGASTAGDCQFNGVLSKKTLSNWTTDMCFTGEGTLIINEETDIPEDELEEIVGRVRGWEGLIRIENTSYVNMMAFQYYLHYEAKSYSDYNFIVRNNSKLETMYFGMLNEQPFGRLEVTNNPKLELDCFIFTYTWFQRSYAYNNKNDCGCFLDSPTNKANLEALTNDCTILIGNITLEGKNLPDIMLLQDKLMSVTTLYGSISIVNTELTDLRFFNALEYIEWNYPVYRKMGTSYLRIENNTKLVNIGWNKLSGISSLTTSIKGNPLLCGSYREKKVLLTSENGGIDEMPFCEDSPLVEGQYRIPPEGFSKLPDYGVVDIVGDLIINENTDLTDIWKLSNVTTVFGRVVIENSKLISTNNLWKINYIFDVGDGAGGLRVANNSLLRKAELVALRQISGNHTLLIADNPLASISYDVCTSYESIGTAEIKDNKGDCVKKRSVYFYERSDTEHLCCSLFVVWLMILFVVR